MSNLAHNETITLKEKRKNYGTMNIRSYMERLGFTGIDTEELTYENDIKVRYYIGYKSIDYYSKKRGVIGIFLSTNESVETYRKLAVDLDYLRDNNLYDQIARDIYSKISTDKIHALETEYGLDYCYWVSGKGIAGGIASEVATIIRKEDNDFKRSNNWYTIKDIYCYTFGAPKTHTGANYTDSFIKNIINEDDYLTKVIPDDKGYRNGFTYNASVYSDFIYNYKNLTRNNPKYTGNYMNMNTLNNYVWTLYSQIPPIAEGLKEDIAKLLSKHISNTNNEEDFNNTLNYNGSYLVGVQMKKQMSNKEIETASSTKAYWTLTKVLEGLDEKTINQRKYTKTRQEADSEKWEILSDDKRIIKAITDLGVWYVNHVATYQNNGVNTNATDPARDYYSHRDDYPMDGYGQRLTIADSEKIMINLGGKKGFFYEPFKDMESTYQYNITTGRNYYKRYLGNDCTGLSQGVIYTLSDGDRGQTGDVNTASDGLFNHNASADKLVQGYDHTDEAMLKLGWEKYYLDGSVWKQKRLYNGEVQIRTLQDAFGYEMSSKGINFLEPGDLLCTSGHVEFYVGYNYEVDYFDKYNEAGEIIEQTDDEKKKNGIESIEIDSKSAQGYSTFGWGGVHGEYPIETNYFTYTNSGFRRHSEIADNRNYTAIWRKN